MTEPTQEPRNAISTTTATTVASSAAHDRDLLIALNAVNRITRAALCRLSADLDAWRRVAASNDAAMARAAQGLGVPLEPLRRALGVRDRAAQLADDEKRRAAAAGCRILCRDDQDYPRPLLEHPLPPPVLYVRGELPRAPAAAIVGARHMNRYGGQVARLFGGGLARAGVVVVSGFAIGVDREAHRAALDAGGKTVAVLGCGVDLDYPRGSRRLAERIAAQGALVSEFPFGTEPRAWHFPVRNRVIAALAEGTLVVQARARSGSLITAHLALDLGRDVWAVPGPIFDELSMGTNGLLADGAALVQSPDDVLDHMGLGELGLRGRLPGTGVQRSLLPTAPAMPGDGTGGGMNEGPSRPLPPAPLPKGLGGKLVQALRARGAGAAGGGMTAEELAADIGETIDRVLGVLLELELGGWVERLPGPVYAA